MILLLITSDHINNWKKIIKIIVSMELMENIIFLFIHHESNCWYSAKKNREKRRRKIRKMQTQTQTFQSNLNVALIWLKLAMQPFRQFYTEIQKNKNWKEKSGSKSKERRNYVKCHAKAKQIPKFSPEWLRKVLMRK